MLEVGPLGFELFAPSLGGQFGQFPLRDIDVCDDGTPGLVRRQRGHAHQEPLLLVGRVTGILHREQLLLAGDDRPDTFDGFTGVLVGVDVCRSEVVHPL